MIEHTRYYYSNALQKVVVKLTPNTVADAEQRLGMKKAEPVIIAMDALYYYALDHADKYGSPLSEDYVLGAEWLDAIKGVRGLLNGAGHFDGGTLESLFWSAIEVAGFSEEDL